MATNSPNTALSVPNDWQVLTAAQIAAPAQYSIVGGPFGSELTTKHYSQSGVPVIRGTNLNGRSRWLVEQGFVYVPEEKADQLARNLAYPGDVVFTQRGTLGQVARIHPGTDIHRFVLSQSQMKLAVDEAIADPDFVCFYFTSPMALRIIDRMTIATGLPHINLGILKSFPIPIPPIPEQKKIAAILSSVDEAIEDTQAVVEQLQVVKKAMMGELLTKGIPGRHSRFRKTEIGEVPEGWGVVRLQDICVEGGLQTGPFGSQLKASEYTPDGIPVVMPRDLIDQRINTDSIARIPDWRAAELPHHRVSPGDILFARRGDIGRCALVTRQEAGWVCGTGCLRARPLPQMHGEYLVRYLSFEPVIAWLTERAVGQTMLNLNTEILSGTPVAVPPREEQIEIASVLAAIEENASANEAKCAALLELKAALLSVLLTGEVRVRVDVEGNANTDVKAVRKMSSELERARR